MKPIRLELKGFTSFRDRLEIDFEDLDLFAVTGPTGAGKTSLIDAMIFALYGSTPRVGSNAAELISLGGRRAQVMLEFSAGSKRYRIARTIKKTKKSIAGDRRLEVRNGRSEWLPLAHKERETRRRISEIVGLDFNGFTKSVVLPQGEFDRFLNGDPQERRRILTDLLQLGVYEEMGRRARAREKDAASKASVLREQLKSHFGDATHEALKTLRAELRRSRKEKRDCEAALSILAKAEPIALEIRRGAAALESALKETEATQVRLRKADARQKEAHAALASLKQEILKTESRLRHIGYDPKLHLQLSALLPRAQRLSALGQSIGQRQSSMRKLEESLQELEKQSSAAVRRQESAADKSRAAEADCKKMDEECRRLAAVHGGPAAIRELAERAASQSALAEKRSRIRKSLAEVEDRRQAALSDLSQLRQQLEKSQTELRDAQSEVRRLQVLHAADHLRPYLKTGKPCPVCLQTVHKTPGRQGHPALESADSALREKREALDGVKEKIAQREALRDALPRESLALEQSEKSIADQIRSLEQQISRVLDCSPGARPESELRELADRVEARQSRAEQLRKTSEDLRGAERRALEAATRKARQYELKKKDAHAVRQALQRDQVEADELQAELRQWPDLKQLKKQLDQLEKACKEEESLEKLNSQRASRQSDLKERSVQAEKEIHLLKESLTKLEETRDKESSNLKRLKKSLDRIWGDGRREGGLLRQGRDEAEAVAEEKARMESRKERLADLISRSEEKLDQLAERVHQAGAIRKQAKQLEGEAAVARELGLALRAGQFITFVQEEALLRLAETATGHLRSLSSQRYSFSVRAGNFDVVDHWNADETRSVATLSGGESFLASLALALALAESIAEFSAEREGFDLESLFLDEGFSTLDSETLDIVVQAIERLAAGERMIGVVSHVPELAERFPTRIVVAKSVGGSTVSVV